MRRGRFMLPPYLARVGVDGSDPPAPSLLRVHLPEASVFNPTPGFSRLSFQSLRRGRLYRSTPIDSGHKYQVERGIVRGAIPLRAALRAGTEPRRLLTCEWCFRVEVSRGLHLVTHHKPVWTSSAILTAGCITPSTTNPFGPAAPYLLPDASRLPPRAACSIPFLS